MNDHKLMRATIGAIPIERPRPTPEAPQGLCLDKGYDYPEVPALAAEFGFTLHLRPRGEEARAKRHAGANARRWVVGRAQPLLAQPLPPPPDPLGGAAGRLLGRGGTSPSASSPGAPSPYRDRL